MLRILSAGLVALAWLAGNVAAQEAYPTRPVTLVSPYPPGGAADLTARPLAPALERVLKQPVIVVNRTGAGGAVGTQFVSTAPADGYTLMITVFSISTIPEADRVAGRKPRWSRDQFIPIARVNADPTMLIVHPSTPWKSVKTLVADAKKRPNDIVFVSAGPYTVAHMSIEVFMQTAGIKMRHLPTTGGGPAMAAIVGGQAFVSALSTGAVTPMASAGKLRILANSGAKRLAAFPEIPTLKELGYELGDNAFEDAFLRFKSLADVKKHVYDEDIEALVDQEIASAHDRIKVVALTVIAGTGGPQKATITLDVNGKHHTHESTGDGPVDATFKAIKAIVPHEARLPLYQVSAVTEGTDAQAEVSVRLEEEGKTVTGRGADIDTLVASARAYVSALNKLMTRRAKHRPEALKAV